MCQHAMKVGGVIPSQTILHSLDKHKNVLISSSIDSSIDIDFVTPVPTCAWGQVGVPHLCMGTGVTLYCKSVS